MKIISTENLSKGLGNKKVDAKHVVISILQARRQRFGLNQTQLAKRLKWTQHKLSEIEAGRTKLTLDTLNELATALEVKVNIEITDI